MAMGFANNRGCSALEPPLMTPTLDILRVGYFPIHPRPLRSYDTRRGFFAHPSGASVMNILTVSREYGAGGGEVAQRLAAALGWELLDRELLHQAAAVEHVP